MRSSYAINSYDKVFGSLVSWFRPAKCVELGVLDGYSTISISTALRANGVGHLDSYDLFEEYPYNHGSQKDVQFQIDQLGLSEFVTLHKANAYEVNKEHEDRSIQLLHVDISNTGDTVHKIMQLWDSKLDTGSLLLFEGGTSERDVVEWMLKYNAPSLKKAIEEDPILNSKYVYATYLKFPGLTTCLKKRL